MRKVGKRKEMREAADIEGGERDGRGLGDSRGKKRVTDS